MTKVRSLQTPKEKDEQIAIFQWAALYKTHWGKPLNDYMFAIPNGGTRNIREAVSLKAQGVKAGIPDIFIAIPANGYSGMFMELKRIKNWRLSTKQTEWIERLKEIGYKCVVANGFDKAIEMITQYLGVQYE